MVLYYTELQINERLRDTHLLYNRKGQKSEPTTTEKGNDEEDPNS